MTDEELHLKLDELFFDFENKHFQNEGVWPKRVNLVFAFADYIDSLNDEDIGEYLNSDDTKLITKLRNTVRQGTDKWLNENMKTLLL